MNITREQLNYIKRSMDFDEQQIGVIEDGAMAGLSYKQIKFYATTIFSYAQMHEIYLGFKAGLSIDDVELFANSEKSPNRMKQIRLGLEHGLGDKVCYYKDFDNNNMMRSVRLLLERDLHPDYLSYIYSMGYDSTISLDHKQVLICGIGVLSKISHSNINRLIHNKKYCNALYHSFSHPISSKHVDIESITINFRSSFNRYYKKLFDTV